MDKEKRDSSHRIPDSSEYDGGFHGKKRKAKDQYERAYEKQLQKFNTLDYDEETEDMFPENASGRIYEHHPNLVKNEEYDDETSYSDGRNKKTRQNNHQKRHINKSRTQHHRNSSNGLSERKKHDDNRSKNSQHRSSPKKYETEKEYTGKNRNKTDNIGGNKRMRDSGVVKKKHSPVKIIITVILLIVLIIAIISQVLLFKYLSKVTYLENGQRKVTNGSMKSDDVTNILIIGSDTRDNIQENGRTDSMILMSINKKTKKITMTSFMRDMYVAIPNLDTQKYGLADNKDKLNAAYAYGGAELLMDTIEYNFDIHVDKYIYIDFFSFIDIVDAVNGIKLDITEEEAEGMKDPMDEQNYYLNKPDESDYLKQTGKDIQVNGNQALAYARLRYVGDADFERTQRQRTVIDKILEKSKTLGIFELDNFASVCASNLKTNMTKSELYFFAYRVPFIMGYERNELRIPADGAWSYGWTADGQSIVEVDLEKSKQTLKNTIYS